MNRKTVLVTGALGLIGHAVRLRLEERGDKVVAIDRVAGQIDGFDVSECDVTDIHGLYALARRHDFTHIVHCGAFSGPMVAADHPSRIVQVNIGGAVNIAELARNIGGARVAFASTATAYGVTPPGPVPEHTIMIPDSVYGATKASAEHLLNAYKLQFGLDTVSLRISWVYGPRRRTACLIRDMLCDALAGRASHIPFGKDFPRQYVHVDDVARAMLLALDTPLLPEQSYNITGGRRHTIGEVADIVSRVIPGARISVAPGEDPGDMRQALFDISAAARDLGYSPRVTLEDGIRSYFDWLKTERSTE
ncbi:NAD-dependent epimerase/dehydratase family protein [Celeribacter indicus]|uniref:NAD-dependent epimerase/dehydratase n=1 Tax=Celeribacter indicus TaxID=1208324 RepID=A0A0B5DZA5_9RHOB|nr:NAD(P)-dependent oxidoreductase [Celeribacter indicus]AJE48768.1 NAD-dependent epimerase/dehydratase [Celeribacter indicus]SDX11049.1 UDP-glucose 4-epimerase/UDP-glucuronate 4-epimerase [Celeribacter indicus]